MDVAMATGLNHMRSKPLALQFACVPLLAASGELEMVCGRTQPTQGQPIRLRAMTMTPKWILTYQQDLFGWQGQKKPV